MSSSRLFTPLQAQTETHINHFCASFNVPLLTPTDYQRHRPDASWLLVDGSDTVVARCSLWWRQSGPYPQREEGLRGDHLSLDKERLGIIGHYAVNNNGEAAGQLLRLACAELAQRGCTLAVGPLDGNTWQSYRFIVERGEELPFLLEPDHPADWPDHFSAAGFTPLAYYVSTITDKLTQQNQCLIKVAERAHRQGIILRPFDPTHIESELSLIYQLTAMSFQHNFLYTPLDETDFLAQYRPLQSYIRPDLILIAEKYGQPIGFIFALPNLLQAQRGQLIDTVIIKTMAVHPAHRAAGLGDLLVARCQVVAHELGYTRAIHALMHESNVSRNISRRYEAKIIRRYGLFARPLTVS